MSRHIKAETSQASPQRDYLASLYRERVLALKWVIGEGSFTDLDRVNVIRMAQENMYDGIDWEDLARQRRRLRSALAELTQREDFERTPFLKHLAEAMVEVYNL